MNQYATRELHTRESMRDVLEYAEIVDRNPGIIQKERIPELLAQLSDLVLSGHYAGTIGGIHVFGVIQTREEPSVTDFEVQFIPLSHGAKRDRMPIELFLINYRIISTDTR